MLFDGAGGASMSDPETQCPECSGSGFYGGNGPIVAIVLLVLRGNRRPGRRISLPPSRETSHGTGRNGSVESDVLEYPGTEGS